MMLLNRVEMYHSNLFHFHRVLLFFVHLLIWFLFLKLDLIMGLKTLIHFQSELVRLIVLIVQEFEIVRDHLLYKFLMMDLKVNNIIIIIIIIITIFDYNLWNYNIYLPFLLSNVLLDFVDQLLMAILNYIWEILPILIIF